MSELVDAKKKADIDEWARKNSSKRLSDAEIRPLNDYAKARWAYEHGNFGAGFWPNDAAISTEDSIRHVDADLEETLAIVERERPDDPTLPDRIRDLYYGVEAEEGDDD